MLSNFLLAWDILLKGRYPCVFKSVDFEIPSSLDRMPPKDLFKNKLGGGKDSTSWLSGLIDEQEDVEDVTPCPGDDAEDWAWQA